MKNVNNVNSINLKVLLTLASTWIGCNNSAIEDNQAQLNGALMTVLALRNQSINHQRLDVGNTFWVSFVFRYFRNSSRASPNVIWVTEANRKQKSWHWKVAKKYFVCYTCRKWFHRRRRSSSWRRLCIHNRKLRSTPNSDRRPLVV